MPGCAASALTSSAAARVILRSAQSMKSSTTSMPARVHSSRRLSAWAVSMTKWTARRVVGRRLRAYRSAAIVARSKLSTKTNTVRRV